MTMLYKTKRPDARLAPYVDRLWLLAAASANPSMSQEPEIVLPDGKTELIIHFGDHFEKQESPGRFAKQATCLFAGQITKPIYLRATGAAGMVAVRFKPGGSARFFRFPHHEVQDQVVNGEDLLGREISELKEEVLNAATHDERLQLVERFLLDQLEHRPHTTPDSLILNACRYISNSGSEYTIGNLVKLIGLSERQLERRFQAEVGLSPKLLSRLVRFQRFMAVAPEQKSLSLTEAALACGYYDQAHFIRDFKAFAGVSPARYLSQPHIISDFFTSPDSL